MAKAVDISTSRRIGVLTALMEKMGGLSEPQQAIELFEQGMREAYEALGTVHLSTLELGARGRACANSTAVGLSHAAGSERRDFVRPCGVRAALHSSRSGSVG